MKPDKALNKYKSMALMRCPQCRKGPMYTNSSILPLKDLLKMPERCPVCGQKYEIEVGFWYGTGYVSYAISVGMIFILATLFGLAVGFSWKDNSVYIFIALMIGVMTLLQPWIMRYSRVLYLYVFVRYGQGQSLKSQ